MTKPEAFGYLSCPSRLPRSLLFLRLESAAAEIAGKQGKKQGKQELPTAMDMEAFDITRKVMEVNLHGPDHIGMKRMEKVAEKLGFALGCHLKWGEVLAIIAPEWYHRPETCTGTVSNPGSSDRLLQYRRRARRGKSVFNKQDQHITG